MDKDKMYGIKNILIGKGFKGSDLHNNILYYDLPESEIKVTACLGDEGIVLVCIGNEVHINITKDLRINDLTRTLSELDKRLNCVQDSIDNLRITIQELCEECISESIKMAVGNVGVRIK